MKNEWNRQRAFYFCMAMLLIFLSSCNWNKSHLYYEKGEVTGNMRITFTNWAGSGVRVSAALDGKKPLTDSIMPSNYKEIYQTLCFSAAEGKHKVEVKINDQTITKEFTIHGNGFYMLIILKLDGNGSLIFKEMSRQDKRYKFA